MAIALTTFADAPSGDELASYDPTDLGNAMRVIRLYGGRIDAETGEVDVSDCRLLYQLGAGWVGHNGRFWDRKHGEDLARKAGHLVARRVRALLGEFSGRGLSGKDFWKFADRCGSAGGTSAMLIQAQSYLTVEIDAFDRDPLALNCRNGTVKMAVVDSCFVVKLHDHDPADRITRMAAVDFDPAARAPVFLRVVADSFPIKDEGDYFHRALGYGSTGFTDEQCFMICQGRGRDGKSTILDAAREALGTYAETGDVMTFLETANRAASGPQPDLVRLAGDVRLVILSEPKRGAAWNEGLLKAWTSGSPITARGLNTSGFAFRPVGKLFVECNPFPKSRGDDDGIWRRIKPVLFRRQVPKEEVDKLIPSRIRSDELAGVLNWLIAGVGDWLCGGEDAKGGLREPASLERALEDYRRASSPFGDWLHECCVLGEPSTRELSGDLHASYKEWCERQGIDKPMSARAFGDALQDRQVLLAGKNAKGLKYRGPIRLKADWEVERDNAAEPDPAATDPVPSAGGPALGGEILLDDEEDEA